MAVAGQMYFTHYFIELLWSGYSWCSQFLWVPCEMWFTLRGSVALQRREFRALRKVLWRKKDGAREQFRIIAYIVRKSMAYPVHPVLPEGCSLGRHDWLGSLDKAENEDCRENIDCGTFWKETWKTESIIVRRSVGMLWRWGVDGTGWRSSAVADCLLMTLNLRC
jgi:hypothetical protein